MKHGERTPGCVGSGSEARGIIKVGEFRAMTEGPMFCLGGRGTVKTAVLTPQVSWISLTAKPSALPVGGWAVAVAPV